MGTFESSTVGQSQQSVTRRQRRPMARVAFVSTAATHAILHSAGLEGCVGIVLGIVNKDADRCSTSRGYEPRAGVVAPCSACSCSAHKIRVEAAAVGRQ
jgi:hypothetical protein